MAMFRVFQNRSDAGRQLAEALKRYEGKDTVVYALPRGGVVVAVEIARRLKAPMDLLIVRKIGHPLSREYAIAAVSDDGQLVSNPGEVELQDPKWFRREVEAQLKEARRRRNLYLGDRPAPDVAGKTAIIVDDGLATGLTMKAAIQQVKHRGPARCLVAVAVAPKETVAELSSIVDEVVALLAPPVFFGAIGAYYRAFQQVTDQEVVALMTKDTTRASVSR